MAKDATKKVEEATGAVNGAEKTLDEILKEYGADDNVIAAIKELGVETPEDLTLLKAEDLTAAGMKLVQARKLLATTVEVSIDTEKPTSSTSPATNSAVIFTVDQILPSVPADEAWLGVLKSGGVLKVDQMTYISAVRAFLANRLGVNDIPKRLTDAMENYAISAGEPVSEDYYTLSTMLTRRNYGEIFGAIKDVNGTFVSDKRKKELIERINKYLWPAVAACYQQLDAWQKAWAGSINPATMLMAFAGSGAQLPPGMNQAPDTSPLRDAGDDLRNALNMTLAGTGSVVATAMAYDFGQIRKVLEDPSLPGRLGLANREQMYKQLGISVDASIIRAESSIVRFILSFVQNSNIAPETEIQYYGALYTVAMQINWKQLGIDVSSGIRTPIVGDGLTRLGEDL